MASPTRVPVVSSEESWHPDSSCVAGRLVIGGQFGWLVCMTHSMNRAPQTTICLEGSFNSRGRTRTYDRGASIEGRIWRHCRWLRISICCGYVTGYVTLAPIIWGARVIAWTHHKYYLRAYNAVFHGQGCSGARRWG